MILIKNGRVTDPKSGRDEITDILIDGSRIRRIGKAQHNLPIQRVIEAAGMVVAPGLVDVHVHFREPGQAHKEDIQSGSAAAAKGGYTTVVCMANTAPPIDHPEILQETLKKMQRAPIHVRTVAAATKNLDGEVLTDFSELKRRGAVGFSDDGKPILCANTARMAMEHARALDVPISLHEEDPSLIGVAGIHDGAVAREQGITGAPGVSESSMVARDCMLALHTGAKVHLQHISTAESIACIRLAQAMGAQVTAEVTPQHFSLTEDAVRTQSTLAKLNPPLRTEKDRHSIIRALQEGVLTIIATDHAPHSRDEKNAPFPQAPSGVIGLETALAAGITHLVRPGHLSLMELLAAMTVRPAELYGFNAGTLAEGGPADLVVFDANQAWTVSTFLSKSSNSPFLGQQLYGTVAYTLCNGNIVYSGT